MWSTYLVAVLMIVVFMAVFILVLHAFISADTVLGSTVNNIITQLTNQYGSIPNPTGINTSTWANAISPLTTFLMYSMPIILIIAIVLALAFSKHR